jgi:hypothetical protein
MAKAVADAVLDAALNLVKTTATRLVLCSAQPTTYTEANATYALADVTISSGAFTGPANGTVSGRKLTVAAQPATPVDASGSGTHIALLDVAGTALLFVTTCTSVAVTAGGNVDIGSSVYEITDPA